MNKKDKQRGEEVSALIRPFLKSGDIINTSGHHPWYAFWMAAAYAGIRTAHNKLFLNNSKQFKVNANQDTHSTIFFKHEDLMKFLPQAYGNKDFFEDVSSGDAEVFSVELPDAKFVTLKSTSAYDLTVYRFKDKELDSADIESMLRSALPIIGTGYDLGQLVDIALNQVSGIPNVDKFDLADFGPKKKVCSVGVMCVFMGLINELAKKGIAIPRPFSVINQDAKLWPKNFVQKFNATNRWDVEQVYPGNYSNSASHFRGEFEMIVKVENGKIVYQK